MIMEQANEHNKLSSLRTKAQKLLQWDPDATNLVMFKNELRELLNEYEGCQVRIEKQHREIIELKDRKEKVADDKYAELFDFSPTGFFTLSEEGEILDLNRTAVLMMVREKEELTGHNFSKYITKDTREDFLKFLKQIFEKEDTQTCLVTIDPGLKEPFYAQLSGVATNYKGQCLVSVADVTKINETRDKLKDLSLIATHTDELAMITDAAGNIEYVNAAFEKLTGFSLAEVEGKNPGHILQGPETDPVHVEVMREGLKRQVPFSQEVLNYSKTGEKFWLSITINPVFNQEGELIKFIAIEKNITGRKEWEELREFEIQDKETLINSTSDPIWSVKNDFTLVAANEAFLDRMQRNTGIRFKKGDNIVSPAIFDGETIDYWKKNYSRALEGESFVLDTLVMETIGNEKEYFETTFNPIFVKDRVEGVACFARNITEARRNKEAIIDSNRRLQTAQKIARLGYWEYNLKTKELFWSPEVYRIWELDKKDFELTMAAYVATIHPRNRPEEDKFQIAANQGKKHLDVQYRIQLKNGKINGKIKWIRETGILIRNEEEGEEYYEGTIQDITAQKEYENHILNINKKLRSLTSHLHNVQEEERISISREIHDELGQQLTGIKLDASWLKANVIIDCPEKEERLNRLIDNVDTTIDNVRRIATTLRPGVLDDLGLEAAVEWLCSQFQEQTGIKCKLETATVSPGYSEAINTAVYRIFQEALNNIIKHANATEVRTILKEENNNLILMVIDNGKGISANNGKNKSSWGITGMKERAWMLDGIFSIKKRKEGGTILSLSIPLKN